SPQPSVSPLSFCSEDGYEKNGCCSRQEDMNLSSKFESMNVSNSECAAFIKQILCAEVYEEVDLVTKGGNYGWRVYEGNNLYNPPSSVGGNTSASSIQPIFPVTGYDHNSVNKQEGSASITGGYLSRSNEDPCLHGRYLYADLYAADMWAGIENPIGSGNFSSTNVAFNCSAKSPIPCSYAAENKYPTLNYIFSFGEDNREDVYVLANTGVYRMVHPGDCNYVCKKERRSRGPSSAPQPTPSPKASWFSWDYLLSLYEVNGGKWFFSTAISRRLPQDVFRYNSASDAEAIECVLSDSYVQESHRAHANSEIVVVFISNCLLIHSVKADVEAMAEYFIYPVHRGGLREELARCRIPDPLLWVEEVGELVIGQGRGVHWLGENYRDFLLHAKNVHALFRHGGPDPNRLPPLDLSTTHFPIDSDIVHLNELRDRARAAFQLLLGKVLLPGGGTVGGIDRGEGDTRGAAAEVKLGDSADSACKP
ncbi:hypothetical protein KI387_017641, partial [Taxus chinensis]